MNPKLNRELQELCINTIRILSAYAVQNANAGHPGMPMGAAAVAYTLWTQFLTHNPRNPQWFDRDRFVLSGGLGSMLLYSLFYLSGYDRPSRRSSISENGAAKRQVTRSAACRPAWRSPRDRWDKDSATASAWRLPRHGSRPAITARDTRSSITIPTRSAAMAI
jgi:hypothetical protein